MVISKWFVETFLFSPLTYFLMYLFIRLFIYICIQHQAYAATICIQSFFSLPGSYPSPKAGATLVMHKDLLVLFGGWTRPSPYPLHQPERFFDEIHTYSPSKNWWERLKYWDFKDAAVTSDWLVTFGRHFLPFCVLRWNCIVTTHGPPPMAGHSSSVIGNTMVVFGGSLGARQMYECITCVCVPIIWAGPTASGVRKQVSPR